MGIVISGDVSERMLLAAMLKAQAATRGGLKEKQAAGAGYFKNYLGENSAPRDAWNRLSQIPPEVAVARASLANGDQAEAERLFRETTDPDQRRILVAQIITPHVQSGMVFVFGARVTQDAPVEQRVISASQLEPVLQLQLPKQELVMVAHPDGQGKVISQRQVNNAQYGIFIDQTGHRFPCYWNELNLGIQNPDGAVVGVDYVTDALAFAGWQGRNVPTRAYFLAAKKQGILMADKTYEWTADEEGGWQVTCSLSWDIGGSDHADHRYSENLSFRVS